MENQKINEKTEISNLIFDSSLLPEKREKGGNNTNGKITKVLSTLHKNNMNAHI